MTQHVPSGRGFVALLEAFRATGGTVPAVIVGRLLNAHQVCATGGLHQLIATRQVIGFDWRANFWIPMFQFDEKDLTLKVGAQRVRAELPPGRTPWTLATWFASSNARLNGARPADVLDSDLQAVVRAARLLAPAGETLMPQVGQRANVRHAMPERSEAG